MKHETQRLGGAVRHQSQREAACSMDDAISRTSSMAGHDQKKPSRVRSPRSAVVPVARAIWQDAQGARVRLTYVTRSTIDYQNLDTGGHGVIARAWLEKHFTPLS